MVWAFNVMDEVVEDWDGESFLDEEEVDALFGPDGWGYFVWEVLGDIDEFLFFEVFDFFEWVVSVCAVKVFEGIRLGVIVIRPFDCVKIAT